MIKLSKKINILFLIFTIISFGGVSYAQQIPQANNKDAFGALEDLQNELSLPSVNLIISSSGKVGDQATITADTSNINEDSANFLWYLDENLNVLQSGKGKTTFSFNTSKENHMVRLLITENNEKLTENSIVVSSYDVSLTWSTNTYTPPEYKGKALPTRESNITVVAIPNIRGYSSEDLIYTWSIGGFSQVRNMVGKDEFSFVVGESVDYIPVFVEVSTPSRSITVTQSISIPVVRPSVVIYHKPSERYSEVATNTIKISPGESKDLIAKLYNFQSNNPLNFDYTWKFIGIEKKGSITNPNLLTLKIPENSGYGSKNLEILVQNRSFFKERASSFAIVNITQ